jgi:hypothetical protein
MLLLQYAYSQEFTALASLLKQFAVAYGASIQPSTLRHAILAYAAWSLPEEDIEKRELYKGQACRSLIKKLNYPSQIEEADVFAAFLLAWLALQELDYTSTESGVHAKGCVALLTQLSQNAHTKSLSPLLELFEPFIWDGIFVISAAVRGEIANTPKRITTFEQRVKYFVQLCWTGTPTEAWQSPTIEALHNQLGHLLSSLFCSLRYAAIKELAGDIEERNNIVVDVVSYVKAAIDDHDMQEALSLREATLKATVERVTLDEQLSECQATEFHFVELLLSILEPSTCLQGLSSPRTTTLGAELLADLKSQRPRIGAMQYYDFYRILHIFLGGLCLPRECISTCMPSSIQMNIDL